MNIFNTKELYLKACLNAPQLHVMTESERGRLQSHLRKMYLEIERVCNKHGLKMMVAYGSVIGALRHKGFIPWDDDIDLLMPRDDYDLLINRYAEELPSRYKVFAPNSKNGPIYRFAKVVDTTTRFTLSSDKTSEKDGIFIDIFPLENACLNIIGIRWLRVKACFLMYVATSVANYKEDSDINKTIMCSTILGSINYYIRRIIGWLFSWKSPENWYNLFDKIVSKYPYSGYFMVPSGGSKMKYFMPMSQDIFIPTSRLPFDDIMVNVPHLPEKHCEMEYGEWKIIPPINERWQHFIKEIVFDIDNNGKEEDIKKD